MAFTEFFVQPTNGSNVNSGSTTAAASVSVANGAWSTVTNIFTGITGTEFAATQVGDWVSIYLDAATVAVFIAQVTVVGALGISITVSTTAKYGTAPTTGATGRSCKVGGPHATLVPWSNSGVAGATAPAPTRINIKQASYTYTANLQLAVVGTTTAPYWFRGYNTTPGDCDSDPTLAKPINALNATFQQANSGAHQWHTSYTVTGNVSGIIYRTTTTQWRGLRLRVDNASTNSAAAGFSAEGTGLVLMYSWVRVPTTGTAQGVFNAGVACMCIGVVAEGGGASGFATANGANFYAYQCVALNNTGSGFLLINMQVTHVINCSIYNPTVDGIRFTTGVASQIGALIGNVISTTGGFGINNSTGTASNTIVRACNSFFACTSGNENGFGDSPAFFAQQEVAIPFQGAPTNLALAARALARQTGFPGVFENQIYTSFQSAGAVDPSSAIMIATNLTAVLLGGGVSPY